MIGETILHYKILEKLGEGGMGEVYKAQDTKLDRFVALKFLPSEMTASEEDKARFIQEAKAASAMNHPNVCTIHDIQDHNGQLFIVMEFIDGVTLRNNKQLLSEKRILEIAAQVADGLGAAQEKGIVHRDIKPENIMLRKDGIVQIMDFGLAKLRETSGVSRLTKAGTTMGTMGYMSPEQVQGLDVDYRTDIFSLGVVMYEMFSGETPFKGMHETAIMYEIVNVDPPPISTVKEGFNPEIDQLIYECLEKDKDERFQSAKELARSLRKLKRGSTGNRTSRMYNVNSSAINVQTSQNTQTHSVKSIGEMQVKDFTKNIIYNPKLFWGFSFICLAALIYLLFVIVLNNPEIIKPVTLTTILPPEKGAYDNSIGSNLAISPDSKFVAFIADDSAGISKLWIRPINSNTPRVLTDALNSAYPFWSPDSRFIAYFTRDELVKISLESGTILPICKAPSGRGGSWSKNGTIVFTPNSNDGIYKVPASGGKAEEIIKIDTSNSALSLRWPFFLPDGERFLYLYADYSGSSTKEEGIYIASLDGKLNKKLTSVVSNVQYANGYMLFANQNILLAQKLDLSDLELKGDIQPIAKNLQFYQIRSSSTFSVSAIGNLIFQNVYAVGKDVVFLDKNGDLIKKIFDKPVRFEAKLSPNENVIAFGSSDPKNTNIDIWTYDILRNVATRLTFNKSIDIIPHWSNDGKKIYFSSGRESGKMMIYIKNADGSGESNPMTKPSHQEYPLDVSPDGNYILVEKYNNAGKYDILFLNRKENKKAVELIATNFDQPVAVFSPNMKWIAYVSNESGKYQVYIIPFNPENAN
ncbi:MAG TPA: protein kinase [Ignavibacteriaceae bacterium]|nr:protein kinase [Ignavibacteriaceae bacterium]